MFVVGDEVGQLRRQIAVLGRVPGRAGGGVDEPGSKRGVLDVRVQEFSEELHGAVVFARPEGRFGGANWKFGIARVLLPKFGEGGERLRVFALPTKNVGDEPFRFRIVRLHHQHRFTRLLGGGEISLGGVQSRKSKMVVGRQRQPFVELDGVRRAAENFEHSRQPFAGIGRRKRQFERLVDHSLGFFGAAELMHHPSEARKHPWIVRLRQFRLLEKFEREFAL